MQAVKTTPSFSPASSSIELARIPILDRRSRTVRGPAQAEQAEVPRHASDEPFLWQRSSLFIDPPSLHATSPMSVTSMHIVPDNPTNPLPHVLAGLSSQDRRLVRFEQNSRHRTSKRAAAYGVFAAGGKLVAALGATFITQAIFSHKLADSLAGALLAGGGLLGAFIAAQWCFGPDTRKCYPQYLATLKTVSYFGALMLVTSGVLFPLSSGLKKPVLLVPATITQALGTGAIAQSFPNFIALTELVHGRLFIRHRELARLMSMTLAAGTMCAWAGVSMHIYGSSYIHPVVNAVTTAILLGAFALIRSDDKRNSVRLKSHSCIQQDVALWPSMNYDSLQTSPA